MDEPQKSIFTIPYRPPASTSTSASDDADRQKRLATFETVWAAIEERVNDILKKQHVSTLSSLRHFVNSPPTSSHEGADEGLFAALLGRPPLRTGLVIGLTPGSSAAELFFTQLVEEVTGDEGRALVARLPSKGGGKANQASVLSNILGQWKKAIEEDFDPPEEAQGKPRWALLAPDDVGAFATVYERAYGDDTSPGPKLVAVIEDAEGLGSNVLAPVLTTLSKYTKRLPLVLILGLSTSSEGLTATVKRSVLTHLDVVQFWLSSRGVEDDILRQVFLHPEWDPRITITPSTFDRLRGTYQSVDRDVEGLTRSLKWIYSDFIFRKENGLLASCVISDPDQLFDSSNVKLLLSYDSVAQRTKASKSKSSTERADAARLLVEESSLGQRKLRRAHACGLLTLQAAGEVYSETASLADLYSLQARASGKKNARLSERVDKLLASIRVSDHEKVVAVLEAVIRTLKPFAASEEETGKEEYTSLRRDAKDAKKEVLELAGAVKARDGRGLMNEMATGVIKSRIKEEDKTFSVHVQELVRTLRDLFDTLWSRLQDLPLWELRAIAVDAPDPMIKLKSDFEFARDDVVGARFHPRVPAVFGRGLDDREGGVGRLLNEMRLIDSHPLGQVANGHANGTKKTTSKGKGKAREDDPREWVPDVVVAYSGYVSSGRAINLADWWRQFEDATRAAPEPEKDESPPPKASSSKKRAAPAADQPRSSKRTRGAQRSPSPTPPPPTPSVHSDDEAEISKRPQNRPQQARFLRAVGDLTHMGFVGPATRKDEHVGKLVWLPDPED